MNIQEHLKRIGELEGNMNTINSDGTALNGHVGSVGFALGMIAAAIGFGLLYLLAIIFGWA